MEEKSTNIKRKLEKQLKAYLMHLGFDFSLLGSHYIKDILLELSCEPSKIHKLTTRVLTEMAMIYETRVKTVDKNIRWAINKAYNSGLLGTLAVFKSGVPKMKQLFNWFIDYLLSDITINIWHLFFL